MMTTPRFVSLTALAASLFIVILTITQANGLTGPTGQGTTGMYCLDAPGQVMCEPQAVAVQAALQR